MKNMKKDIMGVKNVSVLVGENEYHILNYENENNFMRNLYNHGLPIFVKQIYLKLFTSKDLNLLIFLFCVNWLPLAVKAMQNPSY